MPGIDSKIPSVRAEITLKTVQAMTQSCQKIIDHRYVQIDDDDQGQRGNKAVK